jgi:hypothetical protein
MHVQWGELSPLLQLPRWMFAKLERIKKRKVDFLLAKGSSLRKYKKVIFFIVSHAFF